MGCDLGFWPEVKSINLIHVDIIFVHIEGSYRIEVQVCLRFWQYLSNMIENYIICNHDMILNWKVHNIKLHKIKAGYYWAVVLYT